MLYKGSCHCGRIAFEAEGEITQLTDCNCSICSRKGSLLWFLPRQQFHLLTPSENLTTYTFNKHVIQHYFCSTCGINPFSEADDPSGKSIAAVNVRCLEDFDFSPLPVKHFDGRSH
jgi:hypothetical protein